MKHEGALPAAGLDNNLVYDWIASSTFTVTARWQRVQRIAPYLSTLIRPGDKILDLCCGSGTHVVHELWCWTQKHLTQGYGLNGHLEIGEEI